MDLLDRETGRPYEAGIAMLDIPGEVRRWSDEARAHDIQVLNKPIKPAALRALMAQWRVQRVAAAE